MNKKWRVKIKMQGIILKHTGKIEQKLNEKENSENMARSKKKITLIFITESKQSSAESRQARKQP